MIMTDIELLREWNTHYIFLFVRSIDFLLSLVIDFQYLLIIFLFRMSLTFIDSTLILLLLLILLFFFAALYYHDYRIDILLAFHSQSYTGAEKIDYSFIHALIHSFIQLSTIPRFARQHFFSNFRSSPYTLYFVLIFWNHATACTCFRVPHCVAVSLSLLSQISIRGNYFRDMRENRLSKEKAKN